MSSSDVKKDLTFDEWMAEIVDLIESRFDTCTSDAQAIVEAQPFLVSQCWGLDLTPEGAAENIDAASRAEVVILR